MPLHTKKKLLMSVMALMIAFVMLTVASMAWFTLSTNPEIAGMTVSLYTNRTLLVSTDGEEFLEHVDISEKFANFVPLHPVSTIDGVHWFIPTYNKDGSLKSPTDFIMDDKLYYANVMNVKTDSDGNAIVDDDDKTTPLSGQALEDAENRGYYVYGDIWVKSEEEAGCKVRLSVPHSIDENELDGWYGSYVLPKFELRSDEYGTRLVNISNNVESSIRVGFLIMDGDEGDDPKADEKFIIYEPNADHRSLISAESIDFMKPAGNNEYIHNYTYDRTSYLENRYIKTQPLGYSDETADQYKEYTNYTGGEPSDLYLKIGTDYCELKWDDANSSLYIEISGERKNVTYDSSTGYFAANGANKLFAYKKTTVKKVEPLDIPTDQLVVQLAGKWDVAALTEALGKDNPLLDSTIVATGATGETGYFGKFLKTKTSGGPFADSSKRFFDTASYASLQDVAGDSLIINLTDTNPVRIRVFIWIEGQDVDCWNDITSGVFRVNLELAGESN